MPEHLAHRLEEGIYQIMAIVPQLLASLGILLAGFAIAKMVERGTDAALKRVGFNRWMRDGGVTEALQRAGTELDPAAVMAKLAFWTVMVLVILLSANALGLAVVSSLFAELMAYIPHVIAAVIVLVLGIVLGEFVRELVLASAGGVSGGPTLSRAAKGAVLVLAIFMALEQLGIAQDIVLVAFIAVFGAAALAAGIAFGLGGREVAAEIARDWYERTKGERREVADREGIERETVGSEAVDLEVVGRDLMGREVAVREVVEQELVSPEQPCVLAGGPIGEASTRAPEPGSASSEGEGPRPEAQ